MTPSPHAPLTTATGIIQACCQVKPTHKTVATSETGLKKCLTLPDLIFYGVGCSVGAGVYSLVGIGAGVAGPAISLSFFLSGVACIFTSLTYSEFAARVPITGSAYTFVYVSIGELAAWIVGWGLTLGYGISAGGIARSWAAYFEVFFQHLGVEIPHQWVEFKWYWFSCSPIAAAFIALCTLILLCGVHESAKFNAFMTVLNVMVLIFAIVAGGPQVDIANWSPFMPNGFQGTIAGAGVIFFAYLGFDMVSCLAEEVNEPHKTLPYGIVGSLLLSMTIYIAVSAVVTGMAPASVLGSTVPLTNAFLHHNMKWASRIISYGSMFGLTSATFTCLMGQPRIFYRMAVDGLLPKIFSKVNSTSQVPSFSTVASGLLVGLISFFLDLQFLANAISCGTLLIFAFVNAGVLVLRLDCPENPRKVRALVFGFALSSLLLSVALENSWDAILTVCILVVLSSTFARLLQFPVLSITTFQCPWVPVIPCLGILSNVYMAASLPFAAWMGVSVWLSIGVAIYFGYGIRNSGLRHPEGTPLLL